MTSVAVQCIVTVCMVAGVLLGMPMFGVIVMLFSFLVCLGFLSPNTTALAMEPFAKHAGTASALMGSIQMAAGALGSALVSYFHNGTALPMAVLLFASALVSLVLQKGYAIRGKSVSSITE